MLPLSAKRFCLYPISYIKSNITATSASNPLRWNKIIIKHVIIKKTFILRVSSSEELWKINAVVVLNDKYMYLEEDNPYNSLTKDYILQPK